MIGQCGDKMLHWADKNCSLRKICGITYNFLISFKPKDYPIDYKMIHF